MCSNTPSSSSSSSLSNKSTASSNLPVKYRTKGAATEFPVFYERRGKSYSLEAVETSGRPTQSMLQVVRATPVVVRNNGSLKLNSAHARRQRVHATGKNSVLVESPGALNGTRASSPREKWHSSIPFSSKLAHSLQELCILLESGHTIKQFEKVARKANGMGMEESKLPHNMLKNRYRDVVRKAVYNGES